MIAIVKRTDKNGIKPERKNSKNPIVQMIEDKKTVVAAIKKGKSLSTLEGIKVVSPL